MKLFPATDWGVVLSLHNDDPVLARLALESLCRMYWYPLYAFARRRGYSPDNAADVTQDFFVHLLERNTMLKAERGKGLFRSFLLASFRHFLSNAEVHAAAMKRGGGAPIISLDSDAAEALYRTAVDERLTPEEQYERAWAMAVATRAWKRLQYRHSTPERAPRFRRLSELILEPTPKHGYDAIAKELGMSVSAVKVAMFRLRRDFIELIRMELASTVMTERDVDGELAFVLERLAQAPGWSHLPEPREMHHKTM